MSDYGLSKSKILSGLQCPKRLYLEVHNPELAEESDLERVFAIGHEVGEVARQLYPDGKLIEHDDSMSAALKETRRLLKEAPKTPFFEATFAHRGVLVRADIFRKGNKKYRLVEVKASTAVKEYYLSDCAVQAWVIKGAGYPLERIEIAHVDNTFVYPGNGEYGGLLHYEDVTKAVFELRKEVSGWVEQFKSLLKGKVPDIEAGDQCSSPYACQFQDHCWQGLPEYPVSILPYGGKISAELLSEGIEDIRDIPEGRLEKDSHERVRRVTVTGRAELDPEAGEHLDSLPYPRYYLDFETINFAVPIWAGTRPYLQLPFQWSCHIKGKRGKIRHVEFLDTTGNAPMRSCAEKLLATLGDNGPIMSYGSFEKTRLKELGEMFPDLAGGLNKLRDRVVDLLPLARKHYYHPDMKGSWSIKEVLPTVAPELDYGNLDEVQDGSGAQIAYLEAISPETSKSRRAKLKTKLRQYCKMDTLGLVKLAEFFQEGMR